MNSDQEPVLKPDSNEESVIRADRGPGRPTLSNEALLDKALDLFLEKGFERTSIDAITASAGMAKRTVYQRYGDKTTLFKAALERAIEEWIVPVERLRAAETEDLEETLLRIGRILVANIMSPAGLRLLRITNAESARMPEIGAYSYQRGTEPTLAYLADLFRRRIRPSGVAAPDADGAALAFLYLVVGGPASMTAWGVVLDDAAIDEHTNYCVLLFLHGLLPRDEAVGPKETLPNRQMTSSPTSSRCEPKYDGMGMSETQEPNALQDENRRLRKLLVESMLQVAALRELLENG